MPWFLLYRWLVIANNKKLHIHLPLCFLVRMKFTELLCEVMCHLLKCNQHLAMRRKLIRCFYDKEMRVQKALTCKICLLLFSYSSPTFSKTKQPLQRRKKKKAFCPVFLTLLMPVTDKAVQERPEVQRLSGKQHHNEKLWSSMKECGSFKVGVFEDRRWFIFPLGEELKLKLGTDL